MVRRTSISLNVREKRILKALSKRGPILGMKTLIELACPDKASLSTDVAMLTLYLESIKALAERRLIAVRSKGNYVRIRLSRTGQDLVRELAAPRRADFNPVLMSSMAGATLAIAGCSLLARNELPQYVPQAPIETKITQQRNQGSDGTYWTYCQGQCPGPTPKTAPVAPPPLPMKPTAAPAPVETVKLSADVLFNFNRASLTQKGREALDDLGKKLKEKKNLSIVVVGYSDRLGADDYNLHLSARRAEAVKGHLSTFVDAASIEANGRGKSNPATGDSCKKVTDRMKLVACLQPDRRVEISVTQKVRQ